VCPAELQDYALTEIEDVGPEPSGPELELWREERCGAVSARRCRAA
jgi:hypothetical protein